MLHRVRSLLIRRCAMLVLQSEHYKWMHGWLRDLIENAPHDAKETPVALNDRFGDVLSRFPVPLQVVSGHSAQCETLACAGSLCGQDHVNPIA
jgi:hypothetical protein